MASSTTIDKLIPYILDKVTKYTKLRKVNMYHKARQAVLRLIMNSPFESFARKIYQVAIPRQVSEYDKQTIAIIKKVLLPDSNSIDVGAYRGEILKELIKYAPKGSHFAFEPDPDNSKYLEEKFGDKSTVYNLAIGDYVGTTKFKIAVGRSTRSGLKEVSYPDPNQKIRSIKTKIDTLDNLIYEKIKIKLIKIDVEGAEYLVLEGAKKLIKHDKPYIIFECELDKLKYYETKPASIIKFFTELGMNVSLLSSFLNNGPPLDKNEFFEHLQLKTEGYFIAHTNIVN